MFDLFREIGQTLRHNKLRLALTGFAVAWGIFMLVVLLGMANGLVRSFRSQMMSPGNNVMTVWGGVTSRAWQGFKEGRGVQLKNRDMKAVGELHDGVEDVTATVTNDTIKFTYGINKSGGGYTGTFPAKAATLELDITSGRFINDLDIRHGRKAVVLPTEDAERMFGEADSAVGRRVDAAGLSWTVVGVYNHRWRHDTYIPYTTAEALAGNSGNVNTLDVEVRDVATAAEGDSVEKDVRRVLARQHTFDPDDESALWIWNRFSDNQQMSGGMDILLWAMWIIGILTLLSGVVGVSNIMFVSVRERTHEIGIRRAIGAKRRNILSQVMLESVAITTIFGYIGIVTGTMVTGGLGAVIGNNEFLQNPGISLSMAFGVTVVLVVSGALAGLFPALKATKVKPVEALRDE